MKVPQFITGIDRANTLLNKTLLGLAGFSIVTTMLLIIGNIISRALWKPLHGVPEIAGWLTAISISLALGYTQSKNGHVSIDILVEKFNPSWRKIIKLINYLLSGTFFSIVFWQLLNYGYDMQVDDRRSSELAIIFYPVIYIICLGFFGLFTSLLIQILKLPFEEVQNYES